MPLLFILGKGAKNCNERVYLCVCPRPYLKNHMSKIHQIFGVCCLWLVPLLAALRCVVYFRFCGQHHKTSRKGRVLKTTLEESHRGGGWVKFNVYGCLVAAVFINQPYYNSIRERHRMLIVVASAASAAAGTVDVVDSNDATAIDAASRRLATFHYRSTESRTAAQLRHIRSVMLAHGPT